MKIINAISTVIIIVSVKSTDMYDMMSKATAFVSLFMHIIGLFVSLATLYAKRAIKKKIGKQKDVIKQKLGLKTDKKEKAVQNTQPIELEDGHVELSFPAEQSESAAAIDNSANLSAKLTDKLNWAKSKAKDLLGKKK